MAQSRVKEDSRTWSLYRRPVGSGLFLGSDQQIWLLGSLLGIWLSDSTSDWQPSLSSACVIPHHHASQAHRRRRRARVHLYFLFFPPPNYPDINNKFRDQKFNN